MTFIKDFFKFILYKPLFNLLVFFAWLVPGHSVGWAIVLLTILVRLILWIPQSKALRSPMEMRAHQDDIKAIQEKYKDDKTAQAQATMAFYRERGISPFSGCLPMLIQLPVIFILYRVFTVGLHNIRPDLLYSFTPHLDSINTMFFGMDLSKPNHWVLPIIAGLAQFGQSRQYASINTAASSNPNDPAAMMNKQMVYLFPLMTIFIARSLPAGLAIYWIVTSLFSWFQQVYVLKTYKPKGSNVKVSVRQKK